MRTGAGLSYTITYFYKFGLILKVWIAVNYKSVSCDFVANRFPELAETPWKECVTIKGCYEDIVVVSLQLDGADGSTQYHELAIRQGRIIGSYSIIIAANNDRTLLLLDEKGEILYSDDTLVPQNSVPTFPRID